MTYYTMLYVMRQYSPFTLEEMNKMIPYELEIFEALVIKDKKDRQKKK